MIKASEYTKYGAAICESIKNTKLKVTRADGSFGGLGVSVLTSGTQVRGVQNRPKPSDF
jgi:hypothetical protein